MLQDDGEGTTALPASQARATRMLRCAAAAAAGSRWAATVHALINTFVIRPATERSAAPLQQTEGLLRGFYNSSSERLVEMRFR